VARPGNDIDRGAANNLLIVLGLQLVALDGTSAVGVMGRNVR